MSLLETCSSGACGAPFEEPHNWRGSLVFEQPRPTRARMKETMPSAARAFIVAAMLAGGFVVAANVEHSEATKPASPRAARKLSPVVKLAQDDDFPLDSDFSVEQAESVWARRQQVALDPRYQQSSLRFGTQRVQRSIVERVVKAAKNTGSDPALLMSIADKESSFAPKAKASTSSASGLFQFVDSTWLKALRAFGWRYGHEEAASAIHGEEAHPEVAPKKRAEILQLRNDPYLSAAMAAEMLKQESAKLAEQIGRPLSAGETYLIHFLGTNDAARFLAKLDSDPQAPAAGLLPRPAKANKPIFYERQGRRIRPRSVQDVHEAFEHMMGSRVARYADVESQLPPDVSAYADIEK
jgi:hypothetical protein